MKKTIQINITNRVFYIEEDAYNVLDEYIKSIEMHYKGDDPEGEIAHDFESRMSELLEQRRRLGSDVITMNIVNDVITQIGSTSELFEESDEERVESKRSAGDLGGANANSTLSSKKLYRDPLNTVLGGVLGGMGAYTGIDPNILRILFIILLFTPINTPLIILYIAGVIALPKAITPAQRLEMSGEAVSPDTLWQKIKEMTGSVGETIAYQAPQTEGTPPTPSAQGDKPVTDESKSRRKKRNSIIAMIVVGVALIGWIIYLSFNWHSFFPFITNGLTGTNPWSNFYIYSNSATSSILSILLVLIPIILLVAVIVIGILFLIFVLPISLIIKSKSSPIVKVIMIFLWFVLLYYLGIIQVF